MRFVKKSNGYEITGVPKNTKTVDAWMDAFLACLPDIPKDMTVSTPLSIQDGPFSIKGASNQATKVGIRVLRCLLLVMDGAKVTPEFYPEDPEQVINAVLQGNPTWKDVSPLRRYVNTRLKDVFDPEYLVIMWSKQLENYDANDGALLPSFPKDLYNRYFMPEEIRAVCDQLLFRWEVENVRDGKQRLEIAAPALFHLVYDPLGYEVLETSYRMLTMPDKSRSKRMEVVRAFKRKHPVAAGWKVGFKFVGMPEMVVRPECLLAGFLMHKLFYIPSTSIMERFVMSPHDRHLFLLVKAILWSNAGKKLFQQYDIDPRTMKTFTTAMEPLFFDKTKVREFLQKQRRPDFIHVMEGLHNLISCKSNE